MPKKIQRPPPADFHQLKLRVKALRVQTGLRLKDIASCTSYSERTFIAYYYSNRVSAKEFQKVLDFIEEVENNKKWWRQKSILNGHWLPAEDDFWASDAEVQEIKKRLTSLKEDHKVYITEVTSKLQINYPKFQSRLARGLLERKLLVPLREVLVEYETTPPFLTDQELDYIKDVKQRLYQKNIPFSQWAETFGWDTPASKAAIFDDRPELRVPREKYQEFKHWAAQQLALSVTDPRSAAVYVNHSDMKTLQKRIATLQTAGIPLKRLVNSLDIDYDHLVLSLNTNKKFDKVAYINVVQKVVEQEKILQAGEIPDTKNITTREYHWLSKLLDILGKKDKSRASIARDLGIPPGTFYASLSYKRVPRSVYTQVLAIASQTLDELPEYILLDKQK